MFHLNNHKSNTDIFVEYELEYEYGILTKYDSLFL